MAVDQQGGEGDQEGEAHDVVAALAGLGLDHHPRVEDQRRGDQRRRADLVGAADAPGGEQGDRQPAEVDQRREPVALHQDDPGGVDQLRALRVEPGGEPQRVGEEQVDGRVVLGDPRRQRHVVPGGVAAEHPLVEAELGGEGPLGDREGGDRERDPQRGRLHLGGGDRLSVARRLAPAEQRRQQADRDADDDDPAEPQDAERAEQLQRDDQQRDGDRHVGEAGERAGELGDDPAPQPVAAEADGGEDADHGEAADDVGAERGSHRRGMLVARRDAGYCEGAGMRQETPVPARPQ